MGREARANAAAPVATEFIGVPFLKVDVDKRTVTGVVTDELLDRQGDIVDFDAALKFFVDEQLWPGNIREQHDPDKPVGSKVTAVPDLEKRNIELTAYISEACPDTWTKICDKTLKGFSIGGKGKRVTEKVEGGHTANRLFLTDLYEVSVVDNPANPRAMFSTVAKSVGGRMVYTEPTAVVVPDPVGPPATPTLFDAATDVLNAAVKAAAKDETAPEKHKTSSGKEGKEYAGTDGVSFPITDPVDVDHAARALGRTTQDRAKVKANIIRIAYKLGKAYVAQLPEAWKKTEDQAAKAIGADHVEKDGPEPYDIDGALQAIGFVNRMMANEYWEALCRGAEATDEQKAQIAMLKAACDALLEFLQSEYEEQFEPDADGSALDLSDILGDDDVVEMFAKSLAIIQKAGARHSKGDMQMIQKVHDMSTDLGAACSKDMVPDMDAEKAIALKYLAAHAGDDDVIKALAVVPGIVLTATEPPPSEAVTKLTADLDAAKALLSESQATVAKQAETVAALDERLKTIEGQPMPGGPAARTVAVVDKVVGGPSRPTGEVQPADILKAFDVLASEAKSDDERMTIAQKKLSYMRANRLGEMDPVSNRPRTASA